MKTLALFLALLGVALAGKDMAGMDLSFAKVKLACLNIGEVCKTKAKANMMKLPHMSDFKVEDGKLQFQCQCKGEKPSFVTLMDMAKKDSQGHMKAPHGCMPTEAKRKMCFNFELQMKHAMEVFKKMATAECADAQFYKVKLMMMAYLKEFCLKPFPLANSCVNTITNHMKTCYQSGEAAGTKDCVGLSKGVETCLKVKFSAKNPNLMDDIATIKYVCEDDVKSYLMKVMMHMKSMPNYHEAMCRFHEFSKASHGDGICGAHKDYHTTTISKMVKDKMTEMKKKEENKKEETKKEEKKSA